MWFINFVHCFLFVYILNIYGRLVRYSRMQCFYRPRLRSTHPVTQGSAQFSAMFLRHLILWPSVDIQVKFYGVPRGTSPSVELKTRGVAEYSDFGPIERFISEMVQDRSYKLVLITNRKSHMTSDWYQTRWHWMTLKGVIALIAV